MLKLNKVRATGFKNLTKRAKRRPTFKSIRSIPTKYLLEYILAADQGRLTESGRDLTDYLPDLKREYYRRMEAHAQKHNVELERQAGRVFVKCISCNREEHVTLAHLHFYKRVGRSKHLYHSECKACMNRKRVERRRLAKLDINDVPFHTPTPETATIEAQETTVPSLTGQPAHHDLNDFI